jgi:hypothetical protein
MTTWEIMCAQAPDLVASVKDIAMWITIVLMASGVFTGILRFKHRYQDVMGLAVVDIRREMRGESLSVPNHGSSARF